MRGSKRDLEHLWRCERPNLGLTCCLCSQVQLGARLAGMQEELRALCESVVEVKEQKVRRSVTQLKKLKKIIYILMRSSSAFGVICWTPSWCRPPTTPRLLVVWLTTRPP